MTNIELVLNMAEKNNGMVTSSEITANGYFEKSIN